MPKRQHILRLTLPIPPSINEQYATVNGLRVSTVVARRFKQQVRQKLTTLEREGKIGETLRAHFRQFPPFSGRNTHYPMERRRLFP